MNCRSQELGRNLALTSSALHVKLQKRLHGPALARSLLLDLVWVSSQPAEHPRQLEVTSNLHRQTDSLQQKAAMRRHHRPLKLTSHPGQCWHFQVCRHHLRRQEGGHLLLLGGSLLCQLMALCRLHRLTRLGRTGREALRQGKVQTPSILTDFSSEEILWAQRIAARLPEMVHKGQHLQLEDPGKAVERSRL